MVAKVEIGTEDIASFRERLSIERDEVKSEIDAELTKQGRSDIVDAVRDRGEESAADLYSDLNFANIERRVSRLRAVEDALYRINKGTYGLCTDCSLPVDQQRLEADPAVPRCIECQTRLESTPSATDVTPSL